jgi:hypothetical protein
VARIAFWHAVVAGLLVSAFLATQSIKLLTGLLSLRISDEKARHVVQSVRLAGDGGVYERRPNQPPSGVPELRRHPQEQALD